MVDNEKKEKIKQHIESGKATLLDLLKKYETAAVIFSSGVKITKEEAIRGAQRGLELYKQLQADFDAGNFETDRMLLVLQIVEAEQPQKRAIRQTKNTNQLVLSILTPTELTDKATSTREPIQLYDGAKRILYDGCQKLNRQVQTDIMRFMDLWSEHWGKEKTAELKLHIQRMMKEWKLNSYSSFRARLNNVAAAMTSIKVAAPAGGYVVPFPAVFIEQNTGYFVIRADQTLCKDLEDGSSALLIAPEYWLIDAHSHPYAPAILRKLTMQDYLNNKNSKRNILHWKTLVRSLPHLPQEKQFKKTDRHTNRRIFEPLMRDMNYVKEAKLIDWDHIGKAPENLDDMMKGKFEWTVL